MAEKQLPEDLVLPDYNNSLLNLSCSILNHYGIASDHSTLPAADELLAKNYKHVVVILLDGMGINVLEKNLYYKDFLRRNLLTEYSSVFPPTTTAATTAFLSGKTPVQHGWLGWDVYFEKEDKTVTCFTNTIQDSTENAADYNVVRKYFPYETIADKINKKGTAKAKLIFPFGPEPHSELDDWCNAIKNECKQNEKTFTYAYWENPDHLLHKYGSKSTEVSKCMQELNEKLTYLCQSCKETLFFITADHGHIDVMNHDLYKETPKLADMLIRKPCIEPRAVSFYVKPEYIEEFPKEFNDHFGESYVLYTKEEAFQNQIFGPGFAHENLTGVGDYVAVAYKADTIAWNEKGMKFKSHHAGMSKQEMKIPLIAYEPKPFKPGIVIYYGLIALAIITLAIILF